MERIRAWKQNGSGASLLRGYDGVIHLSDFNVATLCHDAHTLACLPTAAPHPSAREAQAVVSRLDTGRKFRRQSLEIKVDM
jgi:hypothetical protein